MWIDESIMRIGSRCSDALDCAAIQLLNKIKNIINPSDKDETAAPVSKMSESFSAPPLLFEEKKADEQ